MKKRINMAVVIAILLGSGLAGVLSAEPQGQNWAANESCLGCHKVESLQASTHKTLSCLDCHAGLTPRTGDLPHQKKSEIPAVNCTEKCHKENQKIRPGLSPLYYPDSAHGKAYIERGEKDVAKCWDCHGKHNIKKTQDPDSVVNRKNIPLTCSRCHANMNVVLKYNIHAEHPYQEYLQSVHGKALFEKGLLTFAAVCTDCHGVHNIEPAGMLHPQAKSPETCGKCHVLILEEYRNSIHGREAFAGNPDVPLCVDCHGEHAVAPAKDVQAPTSKTNVPDTCSVCHARPDVMKRYGVPEDRIQTFIESFHGIAIGFGDQAEASCTSCHGVHDIRQASDPQSTVSPVNLPKTCGQTNCHPGMPEKIAKAKIHRNIHVRKSGAPYYVEKALIWILLIAVALTAVWFIPALLRRIKHIKNP
jgi:hypothetical protein